MSEERCRMNTDDTFGIGMLKIVLYNDALII